MALGIRDIRLGRLKLVSAHDDVSESIAAQLEAVGATALPGERQPRGMNISFPLYGADGDTDPYAQAARHRRQLRALLANRDAVMQGLYFAWVADPELNGWLLVGGGDISYEEGGVTLGDFKASLESVYKVGAQRTHRPGRRIELYDRRLSTTPRDYRGTIYSTDFAAQTALALNFLPLAVSDALGTGKAVLAPLNRALRDGNIGYLVGQVHGSAATFEQSEATQAKGDVVVFDRRGVTAPAETLAGSSDSQGVYGWEEVYGPDQPLTAADVPVLDNGLVRVRYVAATQSFALDQWVGTGNGWAERGRVTIWRDYSSNQARFDELVSAQVLDWTPEYAAIKVTMKFAAYAVDTRVDAIISLGRGWSGPRVEAYATWRPEYGAAKPGVEIRYSPNDAGAAFVANSGGCLDSSLDAWPFTSVYTADNIEPWTTITPIAAGQPTVTLAVLQGKVSLQRYDDTAAYGATRKAHAWRAYHGGTAAGYCSVTFGIGTRVQPYEAEAYDSVASSTSSVVADAAASGGSCVEETQVTEAARSVEFMSVAPNAGRYGIYARVRVVNGGATGSFQARNAITGVAGTLGVVTTTSQAYTWLYLGEIIQDAGQTFNVNGWRSAGTGTVRIDKVAAVPLERRTAGSEAYDGARDIAQANLYDARSVPILVER